MNSFITCLASIDGGYFACVQYPGGGEMYWAPSKDEAIACALRHQRLKLGEGYSPRPYELSAKRRRRRESAPEGLAKCPNPDVY